MFGIAVIGVFAAYAVVSLLVIGMVVSYAEKRGRRWWVWGLGAAFVMYNLVFWDWLPTVYAHKYYCEKEAGFWVYKTLDQWKAENPGVMEGLHQILQPEKNTDYGDIDVIDERFAIETHRHQVLPLLTTNIADRRLIDRKTGETLAKGIDVGSGVGYMATGGGLKFWLNQPPCRQDDFWKIVKQLGQMRGQK